MTTEGNAETPAVKKKGFNIRQMQTDENKEREGSWMPYAEGLRVKLARLNNPKVQAYYRRAIRMSGRKNQTSEQEREELRKIVAREVLLDWDGLMDGDEVITFSEDKAIKYFREINDFFEDIVKMAEDRGNFLVEQTKEAEGN